MTRRYRNKFSNHNGVLVYNFWDNNFELVKKHRFAERFLEHIERENIEIRPGDKCIFNCDCEGAGPKAIRLAICSLERENIDIDLRILFNCIIKSQEEYKYRIWPECMIDHCRFFSHVERLDVDWENLEIDRYFIALMRRPSVGRSMFAKQLLDTFNRDEFVISCGCGGTSSDFNKIPVEVRNAIAPYTLPILIDGHIGPDYAQHCHSDENFFTCLINVVTETSSQTDEGSWREIFITEKTFKAFAYRQVPVWFAVPGLVQEVRNLGFDVYDDVIDHSYDNIIDPDIRMQQVVEILQDFVIRHSISDMQNLRKQLWTRMLDNIALMRNLKKSNIKKEQRFLTELSE
jgi:hypothetical protein